MATAAEPVGAHLAACPRCREIVVKAPLREGRLTVLIERDEVLPRMRCPTCLSARLRAPKMARKERAADTYFTGDIPCPRCGSAPGVAGWIGEAIAGLGAALGPDGLARPVDLARTTRLEDEAIHRAHRC